MHASSICTRTATAVAPEDPAAASARIRSAEAAGRRRTYLPVDDNREGEEDDGEMRSGGCAVQQELAGDAAAVMRQAVSLARRRGHAQVTPLHVASAVLSDAGGLLRAACLRSRASSHPLQCKALELCFNVALNRLATAGAPAAPPPAMAMLQFHGHHAAGHHAPALSNALAAAFKRAQANQRRGGSASAAEGQHPHVAVAAAKVELEQLVISILDDPSVSRVMREAGFLSADVKANVDKAVSSSEQSSNTASSSTAPPNTNHNNPSKESRSAKADDAVRVLDCMASGTNRCVVVVGESAAAAEGVVKAVMDKVSKGELRRQHERLKNAQLVPFSAASFRRMPREEVETRAGDLCALVRECCAASKGVVLVLEDLGYAAEAWNAGVSGKRSDRRAHGLDVYCPVEHAVMELSRLVHGGGGRGHKDMFWLLGFGAYASYTSCRSGQPSLEAVLGLHPVVVPDGGLPLSLAGDSEVTHCSTGTAVAPAPAASVPSWIRGCQGPVLTGSEIKLRFSSSASFSHCGCQPWHDLMDRAQQPLLNRRHDDGSMTEPHDQLSLANPNSGSSNSVSKSNSSDGATTTGRRRRPKFTELTAENLKILCNALETRVPRHRDIAPGIASAVLQRRSGVTRTARPTAATWLLFQGRDSDGKMAMARELARLVFGSYAEFTCIAAAAAASKHTPDHSGSSSPGGHHSLKRQRSPDDEHRGCMQMFYQAIRENPHRVVLVDGVEHGSELEAGVMNAMAAGTVRGCDGGVVSLEDSIVVCCPVFESMSPRVSSPRPGKQRIITSDVDSKVEDDGAEKGVAPRFSLDLNACAIDGGEEEGSSSHNDMEIQNAVDGVFFF